MDAPHHSSQWGVSLVLSRSGGLGAVVYDPSGYDLRNVKKSKINCFLKHSFNYLFFFIFMGEKVDNK